MIKETLQLLEQRTDITVITVTRRLARRLLFEYNQQQSGKGFKAWPTPDILSWSAWVKREWQQWSTQANDSHIVLTAAQSQMLWQGIIDTEDELINSQATARKSQAARELVIDHHLELNNDAVKELFVYDADASRWLDWHRQYVKKLLERHWLDQSAVTNNLIEHIINESHAIDNRLVFVGIDVLTPLQQQLKRWLFKRDQYIEIRENIERLGNAALLCAGDPLSEIQQAAHWARQQFEQHWQEGDKSIGVIVPRLEQNRHIVERVFREVFYPADGLHTLQGNTLHTQGIRHDSVFNLSMGYSLKQEPVVNDALKILSLCRHKFLYEDFSRVLRSPFILNAQENTSIRSSLDQYFRQRVAAEVSLRGLLSAIPKEPEQEITPILEQLLSLIDSWSPRANPQQWTIRLQECLKLFHVLKPEDEYQTSYQYQVMQSLDDVWFEFARLELVNDSMSLQHAISVFTQMVNSHVFQTGASELPVQVLGLLEAAGMEFSSLWVTGMTEQNWPQPDHPNPFIPLRVQREHGMPHSSAQHEYEYAEQMTQQLLQSSPDVIFSYPGRDGEEEFVPSPLVKDFPMRDLIQISEEEFEVPELEFLQDEQGPAVDTSSYHAGSYVLKDQSQCPFRAFVAHRLKCRPPEEPQPGNDARVRGNLVHEVMQQLWQNWRTLGKLKSLQNNKIEEQVKKIIDSILERELLCGNNDYEASRLFNVVMEWLEQEKQRQPFEVIGFEEKQDKTVNGLPVSVRIDRIDELADGSRCVIDYKTGEANTKKWVGERPDEPQLPLYALMQESEISAVAFANIRAGESRYVGATKDQALMGIDPSALKDVKQIPAKGNHSLKGYESWEDMLAEWQHTIDRLAQDHINGMASVDPKSWPKTTTCNYCDINSVCRLFDWQEEEGEE